MAGLGERLELDAGDLRRVFHNVSDGLVIHPPDSGEILDTNERFAEMVGYSREQLVQMSIRDLTADDWEPPKPPAEQISEAREQGTTRIEWRSQRADGTRFWVSVRLSRVQLQGQERVLASIRDISERKAHERRARAIFDQTYQFTGLMEPDGTLIEANETALEFGDLDRADVVGKPFWECYWWQIDEETQRALRAAIDWAADGEFVRYEVEVQGSEGTEIIDFSIRPVRDDSGEISLLIPEGRPITDRRERRRRLDVYNRVLRHNLRNRLVSINAFANEVHGEFDDPELEQFVGYLLSSSDRLQALAEEMREFDRLKQRETSFRPVELHAVVEAVADHYQSEYVDTTLSTTCESVTVESEPRYLRLAIEELVENAIEHGEPPVRITVDTDDGDDLARVVVSDDGSGLSKAEYVPVVNGATTQIEHPSGIGLWLAKWSVDELGGSLRFDGSDGTTATIRLPLDR